MNGLYIRGTYELILRENISDCSLDANFNDIRLKNVFQPLRQENGNKDDALLLMT